VGFGFSRTCQVALRVGAEPGEASLAAEVVGVALVLEVAGSRRGRDSHPADRIDNFCQGVRLRHDVSRIFAGTLS
jgi:hypothetical protein